MAAASCLILWLGQCTNIDLSLADAFYDAGARVFPWRHAWLTETFSHVILKAVLGLAAAYFLLVAAGDWVRPNPGRSATARMRLRVVGLSALLVPTVISALKSASASHCPWDLARYGGTEPYLRLLDGLPLGLEPGHCLPAGHASSALWLVSLCVYWLPGQPRSAARVALMGLAAGGFVGWMQQLRGAHFLTHTLWSGWLACATVLAVIVCLQRCTAGAADRLVEPIEDAGPLR